MQPLLVMYPLLHLSVVEYALSCKLKKNALTYHLPAVAEIYAYSRRPEWKYVIDMYLCNYSASSVKKNPHYVPILIDQWISSKRSELVFNVTENAYSTTPPRTFRTPNPSGTVFRLLSRITSAERTTKTKISRPTGRQTCCTRKMAAWLHLSGWSRFPRITAPITCCWCELIGRFTRC